MGVSQTICPGFPPTVILLILASQIARITGMSHGSKLKLLFDIGGSAKYRKLRMFTISLRLTTYSKRLSHKH
jgi:hypothetical protein